MNINKLTIGQVKELAKLFGNEPQASSIGLSSMIGEKVIIRTYSAGVWFGELTEKAGNEVILSAGRRMNEWCTVKSISLSAIALYGICQSSSVIAPAVERIWLEAIEIIPCSDVSIDSIEGAEDAVT